MIFSGTMEIPLSEEETLEQLRTIYTSKYKQDLPDDAVAAIERMTSLANRSPDAAKMLKCFCEKDKDVRLTSYAVPDFILPPGYNATLYDAKVNSRGPDDKIYKDKPEIRRWVARGTTMMDLRGPESSLDVVIYANKKFTGGIGDDDESQPENDDVWRQYCLQPPELANEVVCMTKLNGEAAHFSGRYIKDKFYIFTGSKNTHMVIRNKEDVDRYKEDRFTVARTVARAVCEAVDELSSSVRHLLFSFLHHTKCTAVCEILQPDYQHIVDLSYLKKSEINFIAFTPTASEEVESTLTALPPHHNLDLIKALGLCCAPYTVVKAVNILEHRDLVRAEHNKEGEVFYYLNEKGETFGIAKAKSVWYIMLRALREKAVYTFTTAKRGPSWNLRERTNSVFKRFQDIQKWLKLSNASLEAWKNLAEAFMNWLNQAYEDDRVKGSDIRPKFPVIWKKFLEDTGRDDKIPL